MRKGFKIIILVIITSLFSINVLSYGGSVSISKDKPIILKGPQTLYPLDKSIEMSDLVVMVEVTNKVSNIKAPYLSTIFSCKVLKTYKGDKSLLNNNINIIQRGTSKVCYNGYPIFQNKQQALLFLKKSPGFKNTYKILSDEVTTYLLTKVNGVDYLTKLAGYDELSRNIALFYEGDILEKVRKTITLLANSEDEYNMKLGQLLIFKKTEFENRLKDIIDEANSTFITKFDIKQVDTDLVKASDNFGFNLLKQEFNTDSKNSKNILISPLSMFTALTVASTGAVGETNKQMKAVLGVASIKDEPLNDKMNDMINYFAHQKYGWSPGFTKLFNSLWINNSFNIKASFVKTARDCYGSDVFTQDFKAPEALKNMNNWIAEKSGGLINNPITDLDPTTKLDLFNVLHFIGKWVTPFDKTKTKKEPFTTSQGIAVKVDMMNGQRFMPYYEDADAKVGVFQYYNASMMVLLPKGNINELVDKLSYDKINYYNSSLKQYITNVKMPKLNFEYKTKMKDNLKKMGMTLPFDFTNADFSNIKTDTSPLYIGEVLHDCVIKSDEEGTEAAALSAVILMGASAKPKEIQELYLDKPYIFIIQDNNNLVLFAGKVENPQQK